MIKLFITATDTDAGKTYVAQLITAALVQKKYQVAVYKPISAGCELINGTLVNEDAQFLLDAANCGQNLVEINPIAFLPPIAPHIAAKHENVQITVEQLISAYQNVTTLNADFCITEGAGGWRLPLGNKLYLSDFVKKIKPKVIMIVNMKLGCLNHALLTYETIINDGLDCMAWVANCPTDMPYLEDNISELINLLPIPKLATLSYEPDLDKAIEALDLSLFL